MKSSRESDQSFGRRPVSVFIDVDAVISGPLFEGNEALLRKLGAVGACRLLTRIQVMTEVVQTRHERGFQFTQDDIAQLLSLGLSPVQVRENSTGADLKRHYYGLNDKKMSM